jgi:hypothetical protein
MGESSNPTTERKPSWVVVTCVVMTTLLLAGTAIMQHYNAICGEELGDLRAKENDEEFSITTLNMRNWALLNTLIASSTSSENTLKITLKGDGRTTWMVFFDEMDAHQKSRQEIQNAETVKSASCGRLNFWSAASLYCVIPFSLMGSIAPHLQRKEKELLAEPLKKS